MRATAQLWELYQQWKQLTEAEGNAILNSNWREVHRCQAAKQQLQPEIIRVTESAKAEYFNNSDQREFDLRIRECVNELIVLETRNSAVLEQRLEALEKERGELEQTAGRLRQVHKSYVPAKGPVWDQYS
jgi:hypothetical protein